MQKKQEDKLESLMTACGLFGGESSSNENEDEVEVFMQSEDFMRHRHSETRFDLVELQSRNNNEVSEKTQSAIFNQREEGQQNTKLTSLELNICNEMENKNTINDYDQDLVAYQSDHLLPLNPETGLFDLMEIISRNNTEDSSHTEKTLSPILPSNTINDQALVSHENDNLILNPETGLFESVEEEGEKRAILNAETGVIEYVSVTMEKTDMETETNEENQKPKGKKRRSLPKTWKKNKDKQQKIKNKFMRAIPICRCECYKKIKKSEATKIFEKFINLETHTEQNIYLQGCIKEELPQRHRPRNRKQKCRRVFTYSLELRNKNFKVCASAFLAIHGIKKDRLKKKVLQKHNNINDGRGKHNNHPCKVNKEQLDRVHEFISNLPSQVSHYSRTDNKHKKYLGADLSIAQIHRSFLDANSDLKEVISYAKFREIFNYDFNLSFGVPRKDICNVCEKFKVEIMSAQLQKKTEILRKLEIQKELHLRKAEVFFDKLKNARDKSDGRTLSISFDFQKNLPLPVTNVSDEYYRRQLWLHNFGVHNINENNACMYLFTENYCRKGPNEVITALNDYLETYTNPDHTRLEIFCDNCFSQNKNRYLFAYLDQLCSKGLFEEVKVHYPIPGHSMMPIDRDFALIEHKRLKKQTVYNPEYYVKMIKESKIHNPFDVVFLEKNLNKDGDGKTVRVKDFKGFYNNYVKPIPGIASCREVRFSKFGRPSLRESMTGAFKQISMYRVGVSRNITREPDEAYEGPLPLKPAKVRDILHLLQFVPESEKSFFENIIPGDSNENAADESEEERE